MPDSNKISVVIPLYNKREYIQRSVHSILAQTHKELELIIVDDGSTDGSAEMLYSINDPRLRIETQANAGEGAARNKGAEIAKHDWVAYLDADDAWGCGFLEAINTMIETYADTALCATGYYIRTPTATHLVGRTDSDLPQLHTNYFALAHQSKLPFCASSVAINRTALQACGGFPEDEPMGADQDLWCRLLTHQSFALNTFPHATYHEDADGRVCSTRLPTSELPFARRVQQQLDMNMIPENQQQDARRYIAAHLLHLATLNAREKQWSVASALFSDIRTSALPRKKYPKLIDFHIRRVIAQVLPNNQAAIRP